MLDAGLVRFEGMTSQEHRVVSAFGVPGRCIGDIELLGHCTGQATAITTMPCQGWTMSMPSLTEALDSVPTFTRLMLTTQARSARLALLLYHHVLTLAPRERLALTLLNLAQVEAATGDSKTLVVPVTQDMLSDMVGCSRQFVSKHLSQWASSQWVASRYGRIEILDAASLKSIIDSTIDPALFALMGDM